jgi:hypothetical protein
MLELLDLEMAVLGTIRKSSDYAECGATFVCAVKRNRRRNSPQ